MWVFSSAAFAQPRAQIKITSEKPFEVLAASGADFKTEKADRGSGVRYYAEALAATSPDEWREAKITAISPAEQEIFITLNAENKGAPQAVYFDSVKADGNFLADGGFENETARWALYGKAGKFEARLTPAERADGLMSLRVSSLNPVQTKFPVRAGQKFEVSVKFKAAPAVFDDTFALDLSKVADPCPPDRRFNFTSNFPKNVCGIKFSPREQPLYVGKNLSASAELKNGQFGAYLYLLHSAQTAVGSTVGQVIVKYENGKTETAKIICGADIGNLNDKTQTRFARAVDAGGKFFYAVQLRLPEKNGRPLSVEFKSLFNRDWLIAAATLSSENMDPVEYATHTAPEWLPCDMGEMRVKPGTILDFSQTVEPDAGKYGRVVINQKGDFAFRRDIKKSVRFSAAMTTIHEILEYNMKDPEAAKKSASAQIENLRRNGYNLIRMWGLEVLFRPDAIFAEQNGEIFDFVMEEFRRCGIYVQLMLPNHAIQGLSGIHYGTKFKFFLGDDKIKNGWAEYIARIINRKSSITGVALKNNPIVLSFEYVNEMGLGPTKAFERSPEDTEEILGIWRAWLETKYKTADALNSAWNSKFKNFNEVGVSDTENKLDWQLFLSERGMLFHSFCEKVMRDNGYDGLVTQYNYMKSFIFSALRADGADFVSMNSYYAHPHYERGSIKGWTNADGASMNQQSSIETSAGYFRSSAATRIAGRPIIMTEWKHCFWNKFQHEGGLVFPAYAALQNFSAITCFIRSPEAKIAPMNSFTTANSPIARANELFSFCFFSRGDAKKAKHRIDIEITRDFLDKCGPGHKAMRSDQTKLALVTGLATTFPDIPARAALAKVKIKPADFAIPPSGFSTVVANDWFAVTSESGEKSFDTVAFVKTLREKSVLPPENVTDVDKGIFQSDTGQITMYSNKKKMTVITDRSEAVTMLAGDTAELRSLCVYSTSVDAAVGLCGMDGKSLAESSRMVLVYSTDTANSNMLLSPDSGYLKSAGTPPILMKVGKLSASLKTGGRKLAVYPLSLSGERREKLEFKTENGEMKIEIDLAKLKGGPTPFFEVSAED